MTSDFFKQVKQVLQTYSYEEPIENLEVGFMDERNIIMFIPKTQELLDIANTLLKNKQNIPSIEYKNVGGAKFATEYVCQIFPMLKKHEWVKLTTSTDCPLKIETSQCIFYIAPRVEN